MGTTHLDGARPRAVRLAAPLVPRGQRDDWRPEWVAELARRSTCPGTSQASGSAPRPGLVCRCVLDSAAQHRRLQTIDDLRLGCASWRNKAAFAVTAIGILALGMGAP